MEMDYSKKYNVKNLIDNFCSEEWKFMVKEKEVLQTYEAGIRIFNQGDVSERIKILKKGKVKVHCKDDNNEEQIIRLATDGEIIGHRAFGGNFTYSVSATSLTETEVIDLPLQLFLNLLKANNEFCFNFMMFFAEELKKTEQRFRLGKSNNLHQRIATALMDNINAFGYDNSNKKLLSYTLSRTEISSLSNTRYESVVRTLKDFSNRKIIKYIGKQLEILNEEELLKISKINY